MAVPQPDSAAPGAHVRPGTFSRTLQQEAAYRIVRDLRWVAMEQGQPATPEGVLDGTAIKYAVSGAALENTARPVPRPPG